MSDVTLSRTTDLAVAPADLLNNLTLASVNDELRPLVRMTAPDPWCSRPILEWPTQQQLFDSWILLLGVVPVDRHSFLLRAVVPGEAFVEESKSLIHRVWVQERRVTGINGGCRLTDRVSYQSRWPLLGYLLKPLYELVFWLRHRNLVLQYGSAIA